MRPEIFFILLIVGFIYEVDVVISSDPETTVIDSVIYDFKIGENKIHGYYQIKFWNKTVDKIDFSIPPDFNAAIKSIGNKDHLFEIEENISGNDIKLPLLRFPYHVKRTMIAAEVVDSKFLWKTSFPVESIKDDKVLIEKGMSRTDMHKLNDIWRMSKPLSERYDLPEYRLYISELDPGEEINVGAWVGKIYEYYLPYTFFGIAICSVLFSIFYFVLRRL